MFNTTNEQDIKFLMDTVGQSVLIDDVESVALITNAELGEVECRHIHTFELVPQGAYIKFNDETYLNITENTTMRNNKYKANIQHCNFILPTEGETIKVIVGYDKLGRPIYETTVVPGCDYPCIVEHLSYKNAQNTAVNTIDDIIYITIQDNEKVSKSYKINMEVNLKGTTLTIKGIDKTHKGLLIFKLT
ncbi:hypothetical protein MHH85_05110 [Viridibacillus sp. FSL E2-0187]|uniref:hypothetical protein n=1 Tax=Viridibacillus sp. FSL E2-0187 TaxID=2921362 RepID=UPI0030F5FE28